MSATAPLHHLSLIRLAFEIRHGRVSPVDAVQAMHDRIARHDGQLHAYATVDAAGALARAEQARAEIARGLCRGPLHGVPVAVKDLFDTADMPTEFGSRVMRGRRPAADATVVARLRAAGAILLGKLTLTEGAYADHHPDTVAPVNPWGAAHWTGTSSSGSGVAVAAGLIWGALGTDTGGSIRLPSACCGITGIKPTWGRVSRAGALALAPSLDHVGPMARSVADAVAMLGVIAGPDPLDPTAARDAVPDYAAEIARPVRGLAIGIDWRLLRARADDAVLASIDHVIDVMTGLGARMVDVRLPEIDPVLEGWAVQCAVEAAIVHRDDWATRPDDFGPRLAALIDRGHHHTAFELALAQDRRRTFTGAMEAVYDACDVLLVPGLPVAGPTLDYMAGLGEDPAAILAIGPFTAPFDVAGQPTVTVPCGISASGIPIGCQFAGPRFAEALVARAGHAFQTATDWHTRRPAGFA
ncbi:putative amidase AmiD [Tistrella bauzanensis]|uniref:Amidase AmiD n=1 Tax=Tistrella bauzanensis TaxID=657419 RepID=A0ABQ1IIY3_9PROT|nr:amidase [Tistrella bauzanensis]GGB42761.1 putative amidase AmiD [Tistrella bauzanensis]